MTTQLDRLLDVAEKLNWGYRQDTSGGDEMSNDRYIAREGRLTFKLSRYGGGLSVYEPLRSRDGGEIKICSVSGKNERINKLLYKLDHDREKREHEKRIAKEKDMKAEERRLRRSGVNRVLKIIKG